MLPNRRLSSSASSMFRVLHWPECAATSDRQRGSMLWAGKAVVFRGMPAAQKLLEVGRAALENELGTDPLAAQRLLRTADFVRKSRRAREDYRREGNEEVNSAWKHVLEQAGATWVFDECVHNS